MASRKNIWDTLDKLEGRKDSSHAHLQKERVRQGYKPEAKKQEMAKKMSRKDNVGSRKSDFTSQKKQGNWMKVHKLDKE